MTKYTVNEIEGFQGCAGEDDMIRVFTVQWDDGSPYPGQANVWVDSDPELGSVRCTGCSTPLRGMSASCPHVKAVKRVLKKENTDE